MPEFAPDGIDTSVAHPARRYNYWLGGKDNYQADRDSGDQVAAAFPTIRIAAEENRRFLRRAISYAVAEAGIRQILDVGTGIPTAHNVHEVAQDIAPESRVVYVDNDPIVLIHARALLTSAPEGITTYIEADLRDPEKILGHPDLQSALDFGQPVALNLLAILHFIDDDAEAEASVRDLVAALAPGSLLIVSHATADFLPAEQRARMDSAVKDVNSRSRAPFTYRTKEQIARFFTGLDLVEPGIVSVGEWRNENPPELRPEPAATTSYSAVGRVG